MHFGKSEAAKLLKDNNSISAIVESIVVLLWAFATELLHHFHA